MGLIRLSHYIHLIKGIEIGHFHTTFEDLMADILILVIGVELAIMLVRRTPESLVEVMFFVIARKMLIKTQPS